MDKRSMPLQNWIEHIKRWPKWAWGTAVLSGIVLVAILFNPGQHPDDPLQSPTALAVNIFVKFSVVLGLIYLAYYFLRRWQGTRFGLGDRQLIVKETLHISPRRSIHLIQAGSKVFLIGATDQAVSFLADIDPTLMNPQNAPASAQPVDFASLLAVSPTDRQTH